MLTTVEAPPFRPAIRWPTRGKRCYYRQAILIVAGIFLVGGFWFASRYPQLLGKAQHVNDVLPSMAYGSIAFPVEATDPAWQRILCTMGNWLNGMKIGMGFGVLLGGLLHTVLRYYPLKLGSNLYLNSVKGALVGVPGPDGRGTAQGLRLALAEDGLKDAATGIRGWNQKADVGLQPVGRGLFYLAVNSGPKGKQTGDLTLQRWTGSPAAPFVPATPADLER